MTKLNDIFDAMRAAANGETVQVWNKSYGREYQWEPASVLFLANRLLYSDDISNMRFRIKPKTKLVPSVAPPYGYSARGTTPYIDGPGDKIYSLQGTPTELLEYELARRALDGMKLDKDATGFSVTYEAMVKWTEVEET